MCLPDGEAVQWCEVTKPGLVGMLFGLPTLGSFGRVLRVKSFWLVCRNLDGLSLGFLHVVFLTGVGSVGNTAINLGYVLGVSLCGRRVQLHQLPHSWIPRDLGFSRSGNLPIREALALLGFTFNCCGPEA